MTDYSDRLLHVEFKEQEDIDMYKEWRKKCSYIFGHGGIKKRVTDLLREDLKKLTLQMK